MKNIIVIALGHLSNGEITIALSTLKHLHNNGYNLLFISHKWGLNYIGSFDIPVKALDRPDPKENKKEFDRIFKEFKADMIICADVYTMDYASSWSGVTYNHLESLGVPIGSFDQYEWESTDFKWDFMGVSPATIKPALMKGCDFLIRPCPVNKPRQSDERILTCRLFGQDPAPPEMNRDQWCDELGIPRDQKVVFTVNSGWEYIDVTRFKELSSLIKWAPRVIYHHLLSVKEPLTVVHVGPRQWEFEISKPITYKYFNRLSSRIYQENEKHADLFCGTNAISITLNKASYALTPCVLFQNLKKMEFAALAGILQKMPPWYRQMAEEVKQSPTFRIFPWGWKKFLEPVFKDNPYNRTFVEAPVFIPQKCTKILKKYLFDETAIAGMKAGQKAYFEDLAALPPVEELLNKLTI
jgi:hypothetical protein